MRKDLTKRIKEGANVPVYVLEYLLGMYCSSLNEDEVEAGVETVKRILAENYVRPDEAQKIIAKLCEKGSYTVIDRIFVHLNIKEDIYEAEFSNLGIKQVPVGELVALKRKDLKESYLHIRRMEQKQYKEDADGSWHYKIEVVEHTKSDVGY